MSVGIGRGRAANLHRSLSEPASPGSLLQLNGSLTRVKDNLTSASTAKASPKPLTFAPARPLKEKTREKLASVIAGQDKSQPKSPASPSGTSNSQATPAYQIYKCEYNNEDVVISASQQNSSWCHIVLDHIHRGFTLPDSQVQGIEGTWEPHKRLDIAGGSIMLTGRTGSSLTTSVFQFLQKTYSSLEDSLIRAQSHAQSRASAIGIRDEATTYSNGVKADSSRCTSSTSNGQMTHGRLVNPASRPAQPSTTSYLTHSSHSSSISSAPTTAIQIPRHPPKVISKPTNSVPTAPVPTTVQPPSEEDWELEIEDTPRPTFRFGMAQFKHTSAAVNNRECDSAAWQRLTSGKSKKQYRKEMFTAPVQVSPRPKIDAELNKLYSNKDIRLYDGENWCHEQNNNEGMNCINQITQPKSSPAVNQPVINQPAIPPPEEDWESELSSLSLASVNPSTAPADHSSVASHSISERQQAAPSASITLKQYTLPKPKEVYENRTPRSHRLQSNSWQSSRITTYLAGQRRVNLPTIKRTIFTPEESSLDEEVFVEPAAKEKANKSAGVRDDNSGRFPLLSFTQPQRQHTNNILNSQHPVNNHPNGNLADDWEMATKIVRPPTQRPVDRTPANGTGEKPSIQWAAARPPTQWAAARPPTEWAMDRGDSGWRPNQLPNRSRENWEKAKDDNWRQSGGGKPTTATAWRSLYNKRDLLILAGCKASRAYPHDIFCQPIDWVVKRDVVIFENSSSDNENSRYFSLDGFKPGNPEAFILPTEWMNLGERRGSSEEGCSGGGGGGFRTSNSDDSEI